MHLDLTDEETFARLNLLTVTIEADRYPHSPRIRVLRDILAKFGPMGPAPARPPRNAIRDAPLAWDGGSQDDRTQPDAM